MEDEELLRQAVLRMLRKKGFEVLDAANGSAAINILRTSQGRIDVMLLDMTIPGASSQEVAAEATKSWPNTRLYSQAVSTWGSRADTSECLGLLKAPAVVVDNTGFMQYR